jgi:hypothetical protein
MYITILKLYFENLIITCSKLFSIGIEIALANAYLEYFDCRERMTLGLYDFFIALHKNF